MSSSNKKPIAKKCEICARSTRNEKLLGPFIEKKTIAAHYNCVIFNPVVPAKEETAADGIGGVSARFIRNEGKRAKALVFFLSLVFFCIFVIIIKFLSYRHVCTVSELVRILAAAVISEMTTSRNFVHADTTLTVVCRKGHRSP